MRTIRYKTHWTYAGPSIKRQGSLADLVLDIPYLMEETGVIPPLVVLNEVLQSGGDSGGMGPGTTWKPFQISEEEYEELVEFLLNTDISSFQEPHPYVQFKKAILDPNLNTCEDRVDWLKRSYAKYRLDSS